MSDARAVSRSNPLIRPPEVLADRLGLEFSDEALLECALRHRSAGANNNERLEFLGDGVLNFVIAEQLFQRRPDAPEGELSRLRATLVREGTLAEIARQHDLGAFLTLGSGELKSGGFRRASILADALEALIGAVYLDRGFDAARTLVLSLFENRLAHLPEADELKDPKTRLQEYLQARQLDLPRYEVVDVQGAAHAQTFRVACSVRGRADVAEGTGSSRRKAEQSAAEHMLNRLRSGSAKRAGS
ncbi:MAG: ribonuclease III [Halothiobacillaceae bacterium]